MVSEQLVDLSRLQFAATALYHFLFVPLTIGMTWILVIMESVLHSFPTRRSSDYRKSVV